MIDQVLLRLTVRRAELRRRTLWPDPEALCRLRAGEAPLVPLDDPGAPTAVTFLDAEGSGPRRFEFASSPPFGMPHDNTVQGVLFEPVGPVRGAVVLFPGAFTGINSGFERFYARMARRFAEHGTAAVVLTAPLHKERARMRADGQRELSGHDLLHGDIFTHVRAVGQAVRDVRATLGWLESAYGRAGVWGVSLGAVVHSLVLTRDARPAFAVLIQPPVGRRTVFESPLLEVWTQQLRESGITADDMAAAFAPLDRRVPSRIAAARILIQAGRHDMVAGPEGIEELRALWGDPRVSWFDHSHTSIFIARQRLMAEAIAFAQEAFAERAGAQGTGAGEANSEGAGAHRERS